jgi:hypothetical protein
MSFLELQPSLAQEIGRALHHQRIPSGGSTEPLGAKKTTSTSWWILQPIWMDTLW